MLEKLGGVAFLYLMQPIFEKIVIKLKDKKSVVGIIILIILLIDFICTIISKVF